MPERTFSCISRGVRRALFRLECNICCPTIDSYAALSLSDCLKACDARGPQCAGVSWVPNLLNTIPGYTCSLKGTISAGLGAQLSYECDTLVRLNVGSNLASGAAPVCNGANDQIYVGSDGSQYRIKSGVNYGWYCTAGCEYWVIATLYRSLHSDWTTVCWDILYAVWQPAIFATGLLS